MDDYRDIRYYTSIINNNLYILKVEIFFYPVNITHNLEILNQINHPTYIIETNDNYYDFYVPNFPGNIPSIINGEEVIGLYLRNNNSGRYDRYTFLEE